MVNKLAIVGIDSLDPFVILKYRRELPVFSKLIDESPTFMANSVFPIDTIPAWMSIYSGLHPGNHGVLYVFDVFDQNLGDLRKLDYSYLRGKTFWDYAGQEGYKSIIVFPMLIYPPWNVNGLMISKSPFEERVNWYTTKNKIDASHIEVMEQYEIPDTLDDLWGGFPGINHLKEWAERGTSMLEKEWTIGRNIYRNEKWDLFFMYFSMLDTIQHRLWRFFDENDPSYHNNDLSGIILKYYKIFDSIVGEFVEANPDAGLIVMSDHGHRSRPYKTVNINEYLRQKGYLFIEKSNKKSLRKIRKVVLEVATRLNIEHWLIKLITMTPTLTRVGKSVYSLAGSIDKRRSIAYLSDFAGIKSYPHSGINVNNDLVANGKYEELRGELIETLLQLKTDDGKPMVEWVKRREELYPGRFTHEIYPDIVFELKAPHGVGWDIYSGLYGKAYDHKVASGGHAKDSVFLISKLTHTKVVRKNINLIDIAPTILDILGIDWQIFGFDGESIFQR